MIPQDLKQKILLVEQLFDEAEAICKQVETSSEPDTGVVIPAINELRYAGFHLIKAISSDTNDGQKDQIRKAKNHCERAIYDAAEVACILSKKEIDRFRKNYPLVVFSEIVPTYRDTSLSYQKLKGLIGKKKTNESKLDHYRALASLHQELQVGVDDLIAQEEEIKKLADEKATNREQVDTQNNFSKASLNQNWVRIGIGILGLIIVITTSIVSFNYGKQVQNTQKSIPIDDNSDS